MPAEHLEYRNYRQWLSQAQEEKLLRSLLYDADESIAVYDRNAVILAINQAGANVWGRTIEDCIGKSLQELIPERYELIQQRIAQVIDVGEPMRVEDWLDSVDGRKCFSSTFKVIKDFEHGADVVKVISQDITEYKQAEKKLHQVSAEVEVKVRQRTQQFATAIQLIEKENTERMSSQAALRVSEERYRSIAAKLRRSEHKFRTFFEGNKDAIFIFSESGLIECNPAALEMFGFATKEQILNLLPVHILPVIQPDKQKSADMIMEMMQIALENGSHRFESVHSRADGTEFYAEVWLMSVKLEDENLFQAVIRDISDRKQAELALQHSYTFLQNIIDSLPLALYVKDGRKETFGQLLLINKTCELLFGESAAQMLGKPGYAFFPLVKADFYDQKDCEALEREEIIDIPEEMIDSPSLGRRIVHTVKVPFVDRSSDADSRYLISYSEDISDRKAAEEGLHAIKEKYRLLSIEMLRSERKFRTFFEGSKDAIGISGENGFIECNPATLEMFGFAQKEQFLGLKPWDISPPLQPDAQASKEKAMEMMRIALEQGVNHFEWLYSRLDGTEFYTEVWLAPIELGQEQLLLGVVRDISDRKQAEAQIQEALTKEKKLNQIRSQFVNIISHEFRNPLATINNAVDNLINYSHKLSEERKKHRLANIKKSCTSIANLIEEVLILSKLESGKVICKPNSLDFGAYCRDLVAEFELISQKRAIALELQIEGDCNSLWLDQRLINLALRNIIGNAIKFSPEDSKVNIKTVRDGDKVIVSIADRGIGIPAEELDQLFESFYRGSNNASIEGTGLGLSIAKQMVDLCGGTISVASEANQGTTFTIKLPCMPSS
jgi:PAS domain S-box-containing protein